MTEPDELRALPKIELHSHLDCGLSYDAVRRIDPRISREHYDRHFVAPPVCESLGDYLTYTLNYRAVLQSERALRIAVEDAFAQLAADGVAYAELRFAPMVHVEDGLSADEVVAAVSEETVRQTESTGIVAALILCTLRDYDAEQSLRTARLAVRHARIGPVAAFDIAGDEARYPLDTHLPAFGLVADAGLGVTVHAGEGGGPDSVAEALDKTTTRRIGHGVRSVEDPDLLARLAAESIHLEVCPSCNVQTRAVASHAAHPVRALRSAGEHQHRHQGGHRRRPDRGVRQARRCVRLDARRLRRGQPRGTGRGLRRSLRTPAAGRRTRRRLPEGSGMTSPASPTTSGPVQPGQVLIFDADDTLWEMNLLFERVIEDYLDWLEHPTLDRAEIRRILDDIEAANAVAHGYGSRVFLRSLGECLEHLRSRPATARERAEIDELAVALIEHRVELLPGVAQTLDTLGSRHQLRLLTKGDLDEQQRKIDASNLAHHFDGIHIVAEKRVDTYVDLAATHALDPGRTWMIGNSPKSDINPARRAGMNAVFIPNRHTWVLEHDEVDPADEGVLRLDAFTDLLAHF